jgi:hypothetical protein
LCRSREAGEAVLVSRARRSGVGAIVVTTTGASISRTVRSQRADKVRGFGVLVAGEHMEPPTPQQCEHLAGTSTRGRVEEWKRGRSHLSLLYINENSTKT